MVILPALTGCASVYLGRGELSTEADRSLATAGADAACSERLWRRLGSPPSVRVECRGTNVWLRGVVNSEESRQALVNSLRRQPGVETVIDRLAVR